MKPMTMVITMAGLGSRFRKAGYNIPKFMIEAKGKTLFEWSMDSLIDFNHHVSKYIFIVQRNDSAREFITRKSKMYDIAEAEIVEIDGTTDGQATTCMRAIPFCNPDNPIMVYNIDTYIEPGAMRYSDLSGDGHMPCFHADGTHWSFVKVDSNGHAVEVKEKTRISDNCSLGAYYFSSARLFADTYEKFYSDPKNLTNGEKYIAPMYNLLIAEGKRITISLVDPLKVHVLGTPEELRAFMDS